MALRIVFMGAGRFALPVFQALLDSPHDLVGLVTQPDRIGPGHHHHQNPLKDAAAARQILTLQPVKIRTPESIAALQSLNADVFVVASYGQILPNAVLDMPRLGTINVHASLLPRHRGATPIHAAILHGDSESGVTIIRLVQELDAGPMLGEIRTPIGPRETTGELEARLAELACPLTLNVLNQLEHGTAAAVEQDHGRATHAGKLTKADGQIDWLKTAIEVERHLRAMQPWPGPFSILEQPGRPPLRMQILAATPFDTRAGHAPGTVTRVNGESFTVACGEGELQVERIHPDGKRPLSVAEFLRGRRIAVGDRFTEKAQKSS